MSKHSILRLFSLIVALLPVSLHAEDRAIVRKVPPVYPEIAKRMHITGTVHIVATVDASGTVVKAEGQGTNKILSNAAEDAVKHWRFASGEVSTVTIKINFDQ